MGVICRDKLKKKEYPPPPRRWPNIENLLLEAHPETSTIGVYSPIIKKFSKLAPAIRV